MNPNEASANKSYNITTNGDVFLPVPTNPKCKFVIVNIIVNTKGGSGSTLQLFDTTEALAFPPERKKGTIDLATSLGPFPHTYPFFDGIAARVSGGTAPDVTIIYAETP